MPHHRAHQHLRRFRSIHNIVPSFDRLLPTDARDKPFVLQSSQARRYTRPAIRAIPPGDCVQGDHTQGSVQSPGRRSGGLRSAPRSVPSHGPIA